MKAIIIFKFMTILSLLKELCVWKLGELEVLKKVSFFFLIVFMHI